MTMEKFVGPTTLFFTFLIRLTTADFEVDCSNLLLGQYSCNLPVINPQTQQPVGCNERNVAKIKCAVADGLVCRGSIDNVTFEKEIPCKHTNGFSFEVSLLLSIFLGMFGIDRFYLGYPAIGLLKLSTLGFMFLGQLIDVILIASQIVGPADGSHYVMSYYGPGIEVLKMDNDTVKVSSAVWN